MWYAGLSRGLLIVVFSAVLLSGRSAAAQPVTAEVEALMREVEQLRMEFRQVIQEKECRIEALEQQLQEMRERSQASAQPSPAESALDRAVKEVGAKEVAATGKPDILSKQIGGATLRLIDLSLDALVAAGASTERDESLQSLQGGGHDPRKRGFTVQNVELSLTGAVDPYFNAEAHIVYALDPITGESVVELEEAFFTSQSLPLGLQLKGGHYFTEFGLINPQHPHGWHWQDQPVINTRLFGPDGMRAPGARAAWLLPVPWYSEFYAGVQNANGETMASFLANEEFFEERPVGGLAFVDRDVRNLGDLLYFGRWENSWDLNQEVTAKIGFSGLHGPNASGRAGETWIYGADLKIKWRPVQNDRGWPFVLWETEVMGRDYLVDTRNPNLVDRRLVDWGFYSQLLYGFRKSWGAGLRYEYATASRGGSFGGTAADPFRDDRHRVSPLLLWHPTEFSRLRLQYNYDVAQHLRGDHAHSVWFGVEFMFGAHPAHKY